MPVTPLARQLAQVRSPAVSAERVVNFYAEMNPQNARSVQALYGTPGLVTFATCGNGPLRAACIMGDYLYVASGSTIYRVASDGTATACIGAIWPTGLVTMATNGTQIAVVVSPSYGYIVTGTSCNPITDPDFPGATSVTYIDGYFIFSGPQGTGRFFISDLFDGNSFDALDFATAEGDPDPTVRVFADHRELLVFGTRTIEVWQDTGGADFPFSRVDGAFIERGCAATGSPAKADNTTYWLGDDRIVYRMNGYVPQRASNFAVEDIIRRMAVVSDAVGSTYAQDGHTFYVLKFHTEGRTFCLDISNGMWHERQSTAALVSDWRINFVIPAFDRVLGGDAWSGKLFTLDLGTYTEDGNTIRRVIETAPLAAAAGNQRVALPAWEIVFEMGVGTLSGQGVDPQVALSWSDDNGKTWSNERWRSLGPRGQNIRRAQWYRLGSARSRIVRAVITDPVKCAVVGFAPVAQELAA